MDNENIPEVPEPPEMGESPPIDRQAFRKGRAVSGLSLFEGCPEVVWEGPYKFKCGQGAYHGVCPRHGQFRFEDNFKPDPGDRNYCHHCDVFIGYSGLGVVKEPNWSEEAKRKCCWVCGWSPDPISPIQEQETGPSFKDSLQPNDKVKGSGNLPVRYADKAMFGAEPVEEEALERPRVYLLSATPDPLGAAAAFAMMYEGRVVRNLAEITDREREHYFEEAMKTALRTPWEAIDLHFMVEGLTRASWDQMVRQRTASFAGESLRFAVKDDIPVRPGPNVVTPAQKYMWTATVNRIYEAYQGLIASGVPAEDARGLMPLNILTRGHYKTNLRNLETEVGKRLCTQAQFEWRLIQADLRRAIREYRPDGRRIGVSEEGEKYKLAGGWQFQYIADSEIFKPICFQKGQCMFQAEMDRGCTIRERVERGAFDEIKTEEWLTDPQAGFTR